MKHILFAAFGLLDERFRKQLVHLLLLMILVAVLEAMGIGLILPYIAIITSPELLQGQNYLGVLFRWSGLETLRAFVVVSGILMIVLFLIKNVVLVLQTYVQSKILMEIQLDLESQLISQYFRRDYLFFAQKNTSELVQNVRNVAGIISLVLMPALLVLTELIVLVFIFALLLTVRPWLTLLAGGLSTVLLVTIFRFSRIKATQFGNQSGENLINQLKWMQQGFGGIKEVKILSKEAFFLDRCIHYSRSAVWAGMKAAMLSTVNRPLIETVWFSFTILLILVAVALGSNGASLLPTIGLLAAAAIRIMPALNRILNSTIAIRQGSYHVGEVSKELTAAAEEAPSFERNSHAAPMPFERTIRFEAVAFEYPGGAGRVLHCLSFTLEKGQSIAFVGPSGAGKTSAVDLLLGLLQPQHGEILVDDKLVEKANLPEWRRNFGYVPQSIYLSDDTIRNNIAFGQLREEINEARVGAVVEQAQLSGMVARLPEGLNTVIGDRGARLSGGQRQRIGIARALYRDPPILVLDEATSALDNETEWEITQAIRSFSGRKTVVIIAHRLSTVAHCDQIVFMVEGCVRAMGSYDGLMRDCEEFRRFATASTV